MSQSDSLNPRQRKAIPALLSSATITDAAAAAGVTRKTVHKWLAEDPVFVRELRAAQDRAVDDAVSKLSGSARAAANTLESIFNDPGQKASVRVQAARIVLHYTLKLRDQRDLARRLADVEEVLSAYKRED